MVPFHAVIYRLFIVVPNVLKDLRKEKSISSRLERRTASKPSIIDDGLLRKKAKLKEKRALISLVNILEGKRRIGIICDCEETLEY